ncbi:hypothetical protein L2E82_21030 [Cichorium intybus]|uniref:Uncharacterized protein n=1 Tax=Cichorium intybus TaxID=13427 RepID=A0ACB9DVA8_CICIN|nr:hypothetical protein L2E82_21030 [Cichorium intybus]
MKKTISNLDRCSESRPLTIDENSERNHALQRLLEIERRNCQDLKQKSRLKWLIDGDENSKFFHGVINNKNRRHRINGLLINGRWTEDVTEIKTAVFEFFEDKFREPSANRPKFVNSNLRSITPQSAQELEALISVEEIKTAVWACGSDRAPGPDGYTFKFIKMFWDTIKADVVRFVRYFEEFGNLAVGCNSSFITLVPKTKDPNSLSDYRPISLIGCMYKIIAKILALRLKRVMNDIIGEVQTAYIEGRNILDGPLVTNEICSWAKKVKKKILLFKVDFDKAFDSINWEYLNSVLVQMGFGNKWCRWINGCLRSSRASVLVNGAPTKEFEITRGVRQGDPLSPFLFIIAMEGLNAALLSAREHDIFNGVKLPNNGPSVSHLFYADDALFIGEWSRSNVKNLARILRCFHAASGLKVNFSKSKVFGVGVSTNELNQYANILGCEVGHMPFKYLGVPVGANMNLKKNWKPVIDRFHSKLSLWKAKTLSFGGRVTLIKAVLGNLPTYYLSLYKAPIGVLDQLEKIRRKFIWGGDESNNKTRWVSWDKVIASKECGGLGVGSLQALNIGLLVKWWWRLKISTLSLWCQVITAIHNLPFII